MDKEERDRALFNRIAASYAKKDSLPSTTAARRSKLLFALGPVLSRGNLGTIVDVGCGAGGPATVLRGRYERYFGIDHSPKLINEAKKLHEDNPLTQFIAGNIKERPLNGPVADLILCDGALHHMTELDRVMSSLAALARPAAFLILIEPYRGNPLVTMMRQVRKGMDRSYSQDQASFSREELQLLLAPLNLDDLRFRWQGFFSTPFAEVPFSPQALFSPLSRLAAAADQQLQEHWPRLMKSLAFNIVASGRFPPEVRVDSK